MKRHPPYIRSYYTTFLYCRRSSEPYGFRNIAGSQILTLILILGGPWSFWWFSLIRAKMLSLTSDNKRNTCPLFFFLFLRGGAVIRLIKTKHLQFFLTSFYLVFNHDSWSWITGDFVFTSVMGSSCVKRQIAVRVNFLLFISCQSTSWVYKGMVCLV